MALGMEEAQRQYAERGITITYEYLAPDMASAEDQEKRLLKAKEGKYDVIGVDVADDEIISPLLDEMRPAGSIPVYSRRAEKSMIHLLFDNPRSVESGTRFLPSPLFITRREYEQDMNFS